MRRGGGIAEISGFATRLQKEKIACKVRIYSKKMRLTKSDTSDAPIRAGFLEQVCKQEIEKDKKNFLKDHADSKHPKVRSALAICDWRCYKMLMLRSTLCRTPTLIAGVMHDPSTGASPSFSYCSF